MQNTTIPVVMLHVAHAGGDTRLAVPLHLSSPMDHPWRQISYSQVIYPATFKPCLFMAVCSVLGPCKETLHPTVLGAVTLLPQGISTSLLPLAALQRGCTHGTFTTLWGKQVCGVLGKGQMD